jgi:hypothetical protein
MYLMETVTEKLVERAVEKSPFGPGFPEDLAKTADRMEVWGSSFGDSGADFCEFKLFSKEALLGSRTMSGY